MEKFSAAQFYEFGTRIGAGRRQFEAMDKERNESVTTWRKSPGCKLLRTVKKQCESIDLKVSAMCIGEFFQKLRGTVSAKQLLQVLSETENSIRREMSVVNFYHMPSKESDFYQKPELFGTRVNAKFPSIQYDLVEAGNCFAMGRSTACVFHLMRIMEVGTQKFGRRLGVTFTADKNCQNILDETNKAIKVLPKGPKTVALGQVAAHLYAVKLAWRNQVMHPHGKYTLDEAKDLIGHVKSFMEGLAKL
ncbi:MAG: hypothetical protein ABR865_15580 [Terracidiphilus sp.]|jgi:hypothetical protein